MQIVKQIGNRQLMEREKTLFLCSKKVPYNRYEAIFQWVESLTTKDCILCFNSSELENEVMKALVVNGIPTILVVMSSFRDTNNIQIERALKENRMLIVVLKRDEPKGKGLTARLRNEFIINFAEKIVCGYINKNGSIFPILAGRKNVRHIGTDTMQIVEDLPKTHKRWTVREDKTLLRMFYEDMGLHAIKQQLQRSYFTVRNRIRALTFPDDLLKGREFEDFILELFDIENTKTFSLIEWRGDKTSGTISPQNNHYPDFVIDYSDKPSTYRFAIECKWRNYKPRKTTDIFSNEQIENYRSFSKSKNIPVFIVFGIGGQPSQPEELYIIPLARISEIINNKSSLREFRRQQTEPLFSIKEFLPDM